METQIIHLGFLIENIIFQRSMAGTRDTEMAVGCWQPQFPESNPYGDVHMFRQSLWTEHLRLVDPVFRYCTVEACYKDFDKSTMESCYESYFENHFWHCIKN